VNVREHPEGGAEGEGDAEALVAETGTDLGRLAEDANAEIPPVIDRLACDAERDTEKGNFDADGAVEGGCDGTGSPLEPPVPLPDEATHKEKKRKNKIQIIELRIRMGPLTRDRSGRT
jgi:hypothetical protein